jgi:hypothetical protein
MSKQFIKTTTGKQEVAKPKIKVYKSIADFEAAIANGELQAGELATTEFVGGEDISVAQEQLYDEIVAIKKCIPADASEDNQLLTQSTIDLSLYETKEDAETKLQDAKDYTDGIVADYVTKDEADAAHEELEAKIPVMELNTTNATLTITLGS